MYTYSVAAVATMPRAITGLTIRPIPTPQACRATHSKSLERRPSPTSSPTSSAIGMVTASAWGTRVSMRASTVEAGAPLEISGSASSMRNGRISMNVKTRSAISSGGITVRMT